MLTAVLVSSPAKEVKVVTVDRVKAFEQKFAQRLQQVISTGDPTYLSSITRSDSVCILFWIDGKLLYEPDCAGDSVLLREYLPRMFDLRSDGVILTRWTEGEYSKVIQEWGGYMLKLTIEYPNDPRIDHVLLTTDTRDRIKSFSMHRDVAKNPYYDYELDRMVTK